MKLMTTFEEKTQYYNQVKLNNYHASMRLEGLEPVLKKIPKTKEARESFRLSIINQYLNKSL